MITCLSQRAVPATATPVASCLRVNAVFSTAYQASLASAGMAQSGTALDQGGVAMAGVGG